MGWNQGYTIFESTVIGAYDLGKLDKDLLRVLMEPYRDSDIDPGGCRDLRSKDGLDVEEVVFKIMEVEPPTKPDFQNCTDDEIEDFWDKRGELFDRITEEFGW